jgi:HD-GYP domain-containing protein (c-di-GMP phosphodiesterase class II)
MKMADAGTDSPSRILTRLPAEQRSLFERFHRLQRVGVALSAEQNLDRLLRMILDTAKDLTTADAGTVFVRVDETQMNQNATGKDEIWSSTPSLALKVSVNDSIHFPFQEMRLPWDQSSIAGRVAATGELLNIPNAYDLPKDSPFRHSDRFDKQIGYKTRSMLVVPMKNIDGEVIGVLMLINKKRAVADRIATPAEADAKAVAFTEVDEELIGALGSQAAVSIEKATLYEQIKGMFRGFVESLIGVLERRNYTTGGHCRRMADYAVETARAIHSTGFRGATFTEAQLEELEYAGLLHDIGKLAVPDAVLDKRNKLTDEQMKILEYRFAFARQSLPPETASKLDGWLREIRRINVPRGVSDADLTLLEEVRRVRFVDADGTEQPLLTDFEHENLAIRRGNLTPKERAQIERHIVETWEILRTIPWPKYLRRIPNMAATHHEKLDGSGYPWKFKADEIPLGGKILAIADIFEALTAQDRPYKPPIPFDKTCAIIRDEIAHGKLDGELFEIFLRHKVYRQHLNEETGKISIPKKA